VGAFGERRHGDRVTVAALSAEIPHRAVAGFIGPNGAGKTTTMAMIVMLWVTGYAVFGMAVAVLARSVAPALAIAVAWAGPLEHLVNDAWSPARRYFPGLLLEAVGEGGTGGVSATRAALAAGAYIVLFAALAATVFSRRDITA
jgi:energy-coupling factor transporter ATP-binding protein EcfA2